MPTMPDKSFSTLLKDLPVTERRGNLEVSVGNIRFDSRECDERSLFVALEGIHVDGNDYVADAVSRGARAVICSRMPERASDSVAYALVPNTQHALSRVSAALYDEPSRKMPVIGVTGTDGKSSTVYIIDQLFSAFGEESGFLSTVARKIDIEVEKNPYRQSTPEAPQIHEALFEMIEHGKRFAILESTSHGLSEKTGRLMDVAYQAAVFTNLSHEHLEFHGSFEQYRSDKANLFRALDRSVNQREIAQELPVFGVVNLADPNAYYFRQATRQEVLSYGADVEGADLKATAIEPDMNGTSCILHWGQEARRVRIPLVGAFNVENVLAALLTVATMLEQDPLDLADHVRGLSPLPGRMSRITGESAPFTLIVDYAHTPGAFERVLPMVKHTTRGRLITVFGSAGERDRLKRKLQGRIAGSYAEVVVLTDEDPRLEAPMAILEEISSGVREQWDSTGSPGRLELIPDRREAIARAIDLAEEGDTILCLGKGHESTIEYADGPLPWNEEEVCRQLLGESKIEVRR
ncbi:MAG: UDP-N-acetylmuramoyl-L-alanyl-D-glutamate--2,6-diaminopimelate ligase [Alkalispirochaetaceae bacterium]